MMRTSGFVDAVMHANNRLLGLICGQRRRTEGAYSRRLTRGQNRGEV